MIIVITSIYYECLLVRDSRLTHLSLKYNSSIVIDVTPRPRRTTTLQPTSSDPIPITTGTRIPRTNTSIHRRHGTLWNSNHLGDTPTCCNSREHPTHSSPCTTCAELRAATWLPYVWPGIEGCNAEFPPFLHGAIGGTTRPYYGRDDRTRAWSPA